MMKTENVFLHFLVPVVFVFGFISTCAGQNVKKNVDEISYDNGETSKAVSKDQSLDIPVESKPKNMTCMRRKDSQMHEIQAASHQQFPFMAAIMSQQSEYLCSGVLVSNGMILTTAQCTQFAISYVLLNTTFDQLNETAVSLHVIKTDRFPTFTGYEASKDIGIIYTDKHNNSFASKVVLSNYTNPRSVVDLEGIGFGLNADVGEKKQLQYIGMENRPPDKVAEVLKVYFDCVETKVVTCFKDTGGPVLFDKKLMGIVVKGQEECSTEMSATDAVNKRMADVSPTYIFKAWLEEKIKKYEDPKQPALVEYPTPILRSSDDPQQMIVSRLSEKTKRSLGTRLNVNPTYIFTGYVCILVLY